MRSISLLTLALAGLVLAGCDLIEAPKSVNEMNDKMNQLSSDMSTMTTKMDQTVAGINSTNNAVHDQQIVLPYEALLKPQYSTNIDPVPTDMMPFGKKLAEAATAQELVELTFLWLKHVDEIFPKRAALTECVQNANGGCTIKYKRDADGNFVFADFSEMQIEAILQDKRVRMMGLKVIAGFTPQKVVEEIVSHDILGNSRYKKSALKFLMMRAEFIKEVLLDSSVMNSLTDVGELAEAIRYTEQLEYLVKLPFADRIAYKTKYADPQFDGRDIANLLDRKVAKRTWQSIDAAFDVSLKIGGQTMTGDPVVDEQIFARDRASADALRARVKAYLATY